MNSFWSIRNVHIGTVFVSVLFAATQITTVSYANESEDDFYRATENECMQLEEQLMEIEREKGDLGCYSASSPYDCERMHDEFEWFEERSEECYEDAEERLGELDEECAEMEEGLMAIKLEIEFVDCEEADAPHECDVVFERYEQRSREVEDCFARVDMHYQEANFNCERMDAEWEEWENRKDEHGCNESDIPEQCEDLHEQYEELSEEVHECYKDVEHRYWDEEDDEYDGENDYDYNDEELPYRGHMPPDSGMRGMPPHAQGRPPAPGCHMFENQMNRMQSEYDRFCSKENEFDDCAQFKEMIEMMADELEYCEDSDFYGEFGNNGEQGNRNQWEDDRGEHLDEREEVKFYEIIFMAKSRLNKALQYMPEGPKRDLLRDTLSMLDTLESQFSTGSEGPTEDDVERLVEHLEEVQRAIQGGDINRRYDENDNEYDEYSHESRGVDEIIAELKAIFEIYIPQMFVIFEEEGATMPQVAREAYEDAYAAFRDVLPVCEGGDRKRRVCAAAMEEVFSILEDDMRPHVERIMNENSRLSEKLEAMFNEEEERS